MAVTFLKKAVEEATAPQKSIIDVLKKNLGGYKPERSHKTVHASDITKTDFCPRQFALLHLLDMKKKDRYISAALQATFDVGNVTSDLFREKWAGQSAIGNWRCVKCDSMVTFKQKPLNVPCKHGGKCDWRYEEVNFVCQETQVSGSIDVIMDLGAPKLFLVELKIIKPDDFEKLAAPLAEHRIRTNLYMRLAEKSNNVFGGRVNVQQARVLYVSRGYGKKNADHNEILPFKEFTVERDDDALVPYLNRAKMVRIFKETGAIPLGVCKTSMDTPAKGCSVAKSCFSGKFPATQGKDCGTCKG